MKTKIKILAIALLATLSINTSAVFAESSPFQLSAYAMDTIAGFATPIYSSKTVSNKTVIFTVIKPDGISLNIPIISGDDGVARFELYDYHTKKAGDYKVSAKLENGKEGLQSIFTVYPDNISTLNSQIEPSKLLATADGKDEIYITINLSDQYYNPIKGHEVSIISSRPDDKVTLLSDKSYTDDFGSIKYTISSDTRGISVFSIYDITANTVLNKRIEAAFTDSYGRGGFIETAYAAAGQVSLLKFQNIPANIQPNSDVPFTLTAYDSENSVVPNYSGTIHFSVDGTNGVYASVPNDYTFDIDFDAGTHDFSGVASSFNFAQAGSYHVVATDLSDFTIRGETNITVGAGSQTTTTTTTTSGSDLVITGPSSGTYSQSEITITGNAPSSSLKIQLFDNDVSLGQTDVKADQTFSYQTAELLDGSHTIIAVGLDNNDTIQYTSEEISFVIDTKAPEIENIKFDPATGIKTGDILNITVTSEPNVFQGAVVFNVDIAELKQDANDPTKYLASIQAPLEAGTYPLDVILIDELGNEGSYTDVAIIEVSATGSATINGTAPPQGISSDLEPTDVFGVKATSQDSKITITWQPSTDDSKVVHYRIYFGLSPSNLNQVVDTIDNRTTWYIPNLKNGNEYFLSVVAVDDTGLESGNLSSIVSGIPFSEVSVFTPPAEEPVVTPAAPKMDSTGPEILWFAVASLLISQLYFKFKKKVC